MNLQQTIEDAFERRADITPANASPALLAAINEALDALERGTMRVAEPTAGGWQVNEWLKKAVLLSFRVHDNVPVEHGYTRYFDKVESRFAHHDAAGNTALHHGMAQGASVEVHKTLMHHGCAFGKVGAQTHAVRITNADT